ncbi:MAG: cupin domain-containing protein [Pseudomonadota bacterium]
MKDDGRLWVLGHRIRPIDTDDSYGMVEVTSPPHVPGPPPHYHKGEREFFFIVKGTLDVMSDGQWRKFPAGSFVDLPPNTTHTFINNTEEDVVWLTGWRPKGFQRFFQDFGVSAREPDAQQRSTADELIQKLVQRVESYGMYLAR